MDAVENAPETVTQITEEELQTCATHASELDQDEKIALIEALVFASGEPLGAARLCEITGFSEDEVQDLAAKAAARCVASGA